MSNKSLEERIQKSKDILREDLNTVRAGRANPALLCGNRRSRGGKKRSYGHASILRL